jgi:hypothetical protein
MTLEDLKTIVSIIAAIAALIGGAGGIVYWIDRRLNGIRLRAAIRDIRQDGFRFDIENLGTIPTSLLQHVIVRGYTTSPSHIARKGFARRTIRFAVFESKQLLPPRDPKRGIEASNPEELLPSKTWAPCEKVRLHFPEYSFTPAVGSATRVYARYHTSAPYASASQWALPPSEYRRGRLSWLRAGRSLYLKANHLCRFPPTRPDKYLDLADRSYTFLASPIETFDDARPRILVSATARAYYERVGHPQLAADVNRIRADGTTQVELDKLATRTIGTLVGLVCLGGEADDVSHYFVERLTVGSLTRGLQLDRIRDSLRILQTRGLSTSDLAAAGSLSALGNLCRHQGLVDKAWPSELDQLRRFASDTTPSGFLLPREQDLELLPITRQQALLVSVQVGRIQNLSWLAIALTELAVLFKAVEY